MTSAARRAPGPAATLAAAVALLVALPVLVVVARVGADSGGLFSHLAGTVLPRYLRNTVALALGVGLVSAILGVSTAWLVSVCRFPGSRWLRWALLLPLAIPAYLSAYAYADALQFAGPVQTLLRTTFEWSAGDYWFPRVRSLPGAILVLSLGLYPYVFLAARSAFLEQSLCVLEVSRTLGSGPWGAARRVALPLARPAIVAGLALVLMETLAEFGAVQHLAVDTFATGIYRTFLLPDPAALVAAAQLSTCLLALVAFLLVLESRARRGARYHSTTLRHRQVPATGLRGWRAAAALLVCLAPIALGFAVPLALFVRLTLAGGDRRGLELFGEFSRNSLLLGAVASLVAVVLATFLSFARRPREGILARLCHRLAGLGYAIPGGVIAIGILTCVTWFDRRLVGGLGSWFGFSTGLILSGSIAALVYGYQTRFLPVALGFVASGLQRVRPSLDQAARTLGASPLRSRLQVTLPLLRGSMAAAALLVFVDVMKELPATLILRTFGYETLAVRIHQLASEERLSEAATGGLVLIVLGVLPVLLLGSFLERAHRGARSEWNR